MLTRTLRSKSKRNDQQKAKVDVSEPLQDIGNSTRLSVKADDGCEHSFRRSGRACAAIASQSIAEQSTVKKITKKNAKQTGSTSNDDMSSPTTDMLSKPEKLAVASMEDSNPLSQDSTEKVELQPSPTPLSNFDDSPVLEPVLFLQDKITNKEAKVNMSELTPTVSHCRSTREVEQLSIINVDDESTPLVAHSSSHINHYFSPVKEVSPTTVTVVPYDGVQTTTQTADCKEKFFTPPDNVDGGIASEHQGDPDNETAAISGKDLASHKQMEQPESVHDSHASSSDLARLTRLMPPQLKTPATVTRFVSTPATVTRNTSTPTTLTHSSSHDCSMETPATVTKPNPPSNTSATTTVIKQANVLQKENDVSPEFLTAAKRSQDFQTYSTSSLSGATKKQRVTPTNCFSPAKLKVSRSDEVMCMCESDLFFLDYCTCGTIWAAAQQSCST